MSSASMSKPSEGRYVALLRGVNVGGNNKIAMADLASLFRKAGCQEVSTFIQSGNVLFKAAAGLADRISALIPKAMLKHSGFEVPVIVRSAAQMAKAASKHPFLDEGAEHRFLHVGFLASRPGAARLASLDPSRSPGDRFKVSGMEVYLRYGNHGGTSKLTSQYFDATLGTVITMRNWNSVLKLAELCAGE
jgi:uncharacterized protein (DUF1697 family)